MTLRKSAAWDGPVVWPTGATGRLASGFRKPHRRSFDDALRTLGLWPEEVMMVGDSYELDIAPARAMGMTTVLKTNGNPTSRERPDAHHQIAGLHELLRLARLSLA